MNVIARFVLAVAVLCGLFLALVRDGRASEVSVRLKDVPQAVKTAALKAVKNGKLVEAEKITRGTKTWYELELKAGGKEYEVVVTPDGKVLRARVDEEDDGEDDDQRKVNVKQASPAVTKKTEPATKPPAAKPERGTKKDAQKSCPDTKRTEPAKTGKPATPAKTDAPEKADKPAKASTKDDDEDDDEDDEDGDDEDDD